MASALSAAPEGFEITADGTRDLKGFDQAVAVWSLRRPSGHAEKTS